MLFRLSKSSTDSSDSQGTPKTLFVWASIFNFVATFVAFSAVIPPERVGGLWLLSGASILMPLAMGIQVLRTTTGLIFHDSSKISGSAEVQERIEMNGSAEGQERIEMNGSAEVQEENRNERLGRGPGGE
ncbi:hypothetical protein FDECE_7091 [Fusarium decemcellulare]|nr:hypothetical protein FDECE_7091 [Fusarium decemcellulare]